MIINNICSEIAKKDKDHSPLSDAALCAAATLVVSFWAYEASISQTVMKILLTVAVVVMMTAWLYLSFSNGTRGKLFFPIFTAAYWIVPSVIYQAASSMGDDPRRFNMALYAAGRFSGLLGADAFTRMPLFSGLPVVTASVIMASVSIAVYILGCFYSPESKG